MPTFPSLLMHPAPAAAGAFTWADIASQVARWDMHVSGSVTHDTAAAGVEAVADQVASYDLSVITDTETGPTYSSSDSTFGGAGSATHTAGVDDLSVTTGTTSQPWTMWGVASLGSAAAQGIWEYSANTGLSANPAATWTEGDFSFAMGDGIVTLLGADFFMPAGEPFLFVCYYNSTSSYVEINGHRLTDFGDGDAGTDTPSTWYLRDNGYAWTIMGLVSGEISSATRADMLALAQSERGVSTTTWTPSNAAPSGWWRADLGHALADTDPVTSWANQGIAGTGFNVSQGNASYQPTYDAAHASFNNQAVINFDGTEVLYKSTESWELPDEASSLTAIAIVQQTTDDAQYKVLATGTYTSGGFQFMTGAGTSVSEGVWEQQGGTGGIDDTGGSLTVNTVSAVAWVLTGNVTTTADSGAVWVNGSSAGATTYDFSAAVANASTRNFYHCGVGAANGSFQGNVAEIIYVKRALTAAEDAALVSYLNTRYGTSFTAVTQ